MRRATLIIGLLAAAPATAASDERALLNHCKAVVAAASDTNSAEVRHCRQVIKEWTLRDSRMSVDEDGRPLR